jgi:hypothetical protein
MRPAPPFILAPFCNPFQATTTNLLIVLHQRHSNRSAITSNLHFPTSTALIQTITILIVTSGPLLLKHMPITEYCTSCTNARAAATPTGGIDAPHTMRSA